MEENKKVSVEELEEKLQFQMSNRTKRDLQHDMKKAEKKAAKAAKAAERESKPKIKPIEWVKDHWKPIACGAAGVVAGVTTYVIMRGRSAETGEEVETGDDMSFEEPVETDVYPEE